MDTVKADVYAALLCPERERKKHVGTLLVAMLYGG
jgi:hypothetical protein